MDWKLYKIFGYLQHNIVCIALFNLYETYNRTNFAITYDYASLLHRFVNQKNIFVGYRISDARVHIFYAVFCVQY